MPIAACAGCAVPNVKANAPTAMLDKISCFNFISDLHKVLYRSE